jgi:hypothetical protein
MVASVYGVQQLRWTADMLGRVYGSLHARLEGSSHVAYKDGKKTQKLFRPKRACTHVLRKTRIRFCVEPELHIPSGKNRLQFLPYGRSIGSWICLTQRRIHVTRYRIRYEII